MLGRFQFPSNPFKIWHRENAKVVTNKGETFELNTPRTDWKWEKYNFPFAVTKQGRLGLFNRPDDTKCTCIGHDLTAMKVMTITTDVFNNNPDACNSPNKHSANATHIRFLPGTFIVFWF